MFIYIAGAGAMGCRFGYQLHKAGMKLFYWICGKIIFKQLKMMA